MTREEMLKIKAERGYSAAQLSEYTGVPLGTLTKILSGQTKNPRVDTMKQIEDFFRQRSWLPGDLYSYQGEEIPKREIPGYSPETGENTPWMLCEKAVAYGAPLKEQGEYTFSDLEKLPEGRLYELIDGMLFDMATPSWIHQKIGEEVFLAIHQHIRDHKGKCMVSLAPVGIFLDGNRDSTYVIPDLFVVCDRSKLRKDSILGAPDFVLEVISPSTAAKDKIVKATKYMDAGVREYWIIDPYKNKLVVYDYSGPQTHILPLEGKYAIGIFEEELLIDLDRIREIIEEFESIEP